MIEKGRPAPLGASWDGAGVNFAIYSSAAEQVELCFFDDGLRETERHALTERSGDAWHGYVPGCEAGQVYGYRIHGRYSPEEGLRCNPMKLLIDPYARRLRGEFTWSPAVFDFDSSEEPAAMRRNGLDSAGFVPKSVVVGDKPTRQSEKPHIPWAETVVYEANVRGYTMHHQELSDADRGLFRGMRNAVILDYLKSLGITSVELMPVHAFIDEYHLHRRGLRNLWGYNSINFFSPARRYLGDDDIQDFRDMVDAIHDAGMEVILDVVFNHTGEGDRLGPTLSFRGIDNLAYYRTNKSNPSEYINDTGCGNTINSSHPVVRALVIDSLRYWATDMGVDGFRFDLATTLGRNDDGFEREHPLLEAITADAVLQDVKLIAEPWDPGPGGYQLGNFPPGWAEWNDRYRDSVRRFWRGDTGSAAEFAKRLHGSSDVFEPGGRKPFASINFVTSHDGFTLADIVSYERRHNEANGEGNRDGHAENHSCNYGTEGETADPDIISTRRRHRLNMLATLLLSQGTPMILAGDELGNSQGGNNNAYAQDNAVGWVDWAGATADAEFLDLVRKLIRLRREIQMLRQPEFVHQKPDNNFGNGIDWMHPDGNALTEADWPQVRAFTVVLSAPPDSGPSPCSAAAIFINGSHIDLEFRIAETGYGDTWETAFSSTGEPRRSADRNAWDVESLSIVCVLSGLPAAVRKL